MEDSVILDAVRAANSSLVLTDYADAFKTAMLAVGANVLAETSKPFDLTGL